MMNFFQLMMLCCTVWCHMIYVPNVGELIEMFDKLGECGRKTANVVEHQYKIMLQTRNWLQIVGTIYLNQKKNIVGDGTQESTLLCKIASLWLDQALGIVLEQEITQTVKILLSVFTANQWDKIMRSLSEALITITHNASEALRIGQKIPFVSQASMDDRGAILRMQFCYLAFLKFYPIQEDVEKARKGVKRNRRGKAECWFNFVQEMLSVLKLQKSPKMLLDGFCDDKEQVQSEANQTVDQTGSQSPRKQLDTKDSVSPRRNQPNYFLLERCLNLVELVCQTYIIECCRQRKGGQQENENLKQAVWDVIEFSKELQLAIQRRKGDDIVRLYALDAATSLQLHSKWNIDQEV
eukprot:TRINITY_DN9071_c0_g1_i3.p1 TRINITY_DN9071_c0_g1~~TRINITY_DN9071_c0_g1_i3.p1  ORF type:complete len:352 (+),score=18.17 TRINITY_DN9071_c0_g1_i3:27-1082(+)